MEVFGEWQFLTRKISARAAVRLLGDLSSQRDYVRFRGLFLIVNYLGADYRLQFAEKNFATLLYACLKCMKEGLSGEIVLATRALSLLSMTIGPGDQADELYKEALPLIDKSLSSRDEPLLISAISLLAVCAFVSPDFFVKEAAMTKIWGLILSVKGVHALSAAIAAWSFVMASTNPYLPHWTARFMFTLLSLMENPDMSVHTAAEDAFDVLVEKGSFGVGPIREILMIGKCSWESSSFCKLVQVEYVLNFLDSGFLSHMLGNEYLRHVFNFTPEEQEDDGSYSVEREVVAVRVCIPMCKRIHAPKMRAAMKKARTLLLKKKRWVKSVMSSRILLHSETCAATAEEMKLTPHFFC